MVTCQRKAENQIKKLAKTSKRAVGIPHKLPIRQI